MTMSWKKDLRYGIATVTAEEAPSLFDFQADGSAPAVNRCGIYGVLLPEAPDQAMAMSVTVVTEDVETIVAVQFRFRAKTDAELDTLEDALANSWTKRTAGMVGSARLIRSDWASGASLGQDSSQRLVRSANFYMTVKRPLTHQD
jgi:hypothetical protein